MTILQYAFMTRIVVVAICIYVFCSIIANDYFGYSCAIVVKTFSLHFQSYQIFWSCSISFQIKIQL